MVDVSICIMTYNHEQYIMKCIESVLTQKVNFSYEIIVSDDASVDKTVDIIEKKYGSVIRINRQSKNQGIARNLYDLLKLATGNYIVTLAGDDFYVNDHFLQMAYDFLEKHKGFVSANDWVRIVDKTGENEIYTERAPRKIYTLTDFLWNTPMECNYMLMVRNIYKEDGLEWLYKVSRINDELQYPFWTLLHGDMAVLPIVGHAYRTNSNGSNYNSLYKAIDTFSDRYKACNYLDKIYEGRYEFKYIKKAVGYNAFRAAMGDLLKRQDSVQLKRFIREIPFKERIRVYVTVPLLLLGNGNFPRWYKKLKKVVYNEVETNNS